MARSKISTTVYLTSDQVTTLRTLCEKTKVPVSEYIRQGVDLVLSKYSNYLPGQSELFTDHTRTSPQSYHPITNLQPRVRTTVHLTHNTNRKFESYFDGLPLTSDEQADLLESVIIEGINKGIHPKPQIGPPHSKKTMRLSLDTTKKLQQYLTDLTNPRGVSPSRTISELVESMILSWLDVRTSDPCETTLLPSPEEPPKPQNDSCPHSFSPCSCDQPLPSTCTSLRILPKVPSSKP